jgi:hypothetical protein
MTPYTTLSEAISNLYSAINPNHLGDIDSPLKDLEYHSALILGSPDEARKILDLVPLLGKHASSKPDTELILEALKSHMKEFMEGFKAYQTFITNAKETETPPYLPQLNIRQYLKMFTAPLPNYNLTYRPGMRGYKEISLPSRHPLHRPIKLGIETIREYELKISGEVKAYCDAAKALRQYTFNELLSVYARAGNSCAQTIVKKFEEFLGEVTKEGIETILHILSAPVEGPVLAQILGNLLKLPASIPPAVVGIAATTANGTAKLGRGAMLCTNGALVVDSGIRRGSIYSYFSAMQKKIPGIIKSTARMFDIWEATGDLILETTSYLTESQSYIVNRRTDKFTCLTDKITAALSLILPKRSELISQMHDGSLEDQITAAGALNDTTLSILKIMLAGRTRDTLDDSGGKMDPLMEALVYVGNPAMLRLKYTDLLLEEALLPGAQKGKTFSYLAELNAKTLSFFNSTNLNSRKAKLTQSVLSIANYNGYLFDVPLPFFRDAIIKGRKISELDYTGISEKIALDGFSL